MVSDFETLRSDRAIPCHRQIHSEAGGATVYCVVLADGFTIDCGSDGYAQGRSMLLADAVNAFGPDQFAFGRRPRMAKAADLLESKDAAITAYLTTLTSAPSGAKAVADWRVKLDVIKNGGENPTSQRALEDLCEKMLSALAHPVCVAAALQKEPQP